MVSNVISKKLLIISGVFCFTKEKENDMKKNENYYDKRLYSPTHKMGFKILSESQLKNIFPTVDNLEKKFEIHRKNISKIGQIKEKDLTFDFQYNLMYDSIFSIWGKRGSGKTSAIFTLKYRLEREHPQDVVMPVIMPEMIPAECNIIGWILAVLDTEVEKLENKIKKNSNLIKDNDFFRHCAFDAEDNSLRAAYKKVKELASSININYMMEESSYAELIGNTERYTQNGFDFSRKLTEFWDALVKTIKKVYHMENGDEPLIYVMFDDVDLTPDRVVELFSVIIKYLSHPNVIVITTADEGLFRDVIESDLRKKIGQDMTAANLNKIAVAMVSQWNDYNEIKEYVQKDTLFERQIKNTAELYIDKVLPPAERYYLELFDTCEKKRNFIENTDANGKNKNLEQFVCEQIQRLYERVGETEGKENSRHFMYYKKDSQNYFLIAYLLFMGSTSRQLANQCFILQELINAMLEIYDKVDEIQDIVYKTSYLHREIYRQMQHFLYNSINAGNISHTEEFNTGFLVENLLLFQKEQFPIYVNYPYLLEYLQEKNKKNTETEDKIQNLKDATSLFMLLFMTENILFIGDSALNSRYAVNPNRQRIHGTDDLVELFDSVTMPQNVSLIKRSEDRNDRNSLKEMLYLFEDIIIYPEKTVNFDVSNFNSVRDYIYNLSQRQLASSATVEILEKWSQRNPVWFKTISQILYLSYEGIYTVHLNELKRVDLRRQYLGKDKFTQKWTENINLTNGTHLLKIALMLGNKNDRIYRKFELVLAFSQAKWTKQAVNEKKENNYYQEWCLQEDKRNNYIDILNLEEEFFDVIAERYGIDSIEKKYKNFLETEEILASIGLQKFLGEELQGEWEKKFYDLLKDEKSDEYRRTWLISSLISIIDQLQKRIYAASQAEVSYFIVNRNKIEEVISQMYYLESLYGRGNTADYRNILDYCRKRKDEIIQLNNLEVVRLYQQIERTVKELTIIENERVSINIIQDIESGLSEINMNILIAAQNEEQYEKMEEYLLMLHTLNYFTDMFYAMTLQEEKNQMGSRLDGHPMNERTSNETDSDQKTSFGLRMYKLMIASVKEANSNRLRSAKTIRIQYYLGNLFKDYFIEAGDRYIKQWRHKSDE